MAKTFNLYLSMLDPITGDGGLEIVVRYHPRLDFLQMAVQNLQAFGWPNEVSRFRLRSTPQIVGSIKERNFVAVVLEGELVDGAVVEEIRSLEVATPEVNQ